MKKPTIFRCPSCDEYGPPEINASKDSEGLRYWVWLGEQAQEELLRRQNLGSEIQAKFEELKPVLNKMGLTKEAIAVEKAFSELCEKVEAVRLAEMEQEASE